MNVVNVQPQIFHQYGDISEGMAATVAVAGAVDQAASIAAAVPVFGLIGQEFLASFAYAQANHLAALSGLTDICTGTAETSHAAAASYEHTERNNVESFTPPAVAEK
ncbi:type VII secretion target [Nocardia sp. NPDC051570]|uniref:type VII secretion target n=1 Tax=Nocardia sp. NPDC051570 TaxID=3364324 RepID=UPI00378BAD7C